MTIDEFIAAEVAAEKVRTDAILTSAAAMTAAMSKAVVAHGEARLKLETEGDADRQKRREAFDADEEKRRLVDDARFQEEVAAETKAPARSKKTK